MLSTGDQGGSNRRGPYTAAPLSRSKTTHPKSVTLANAEHTARLQYRVQWLIESDFSHD